MSNWYALQCKAREDERAEWHLQNQGFRVLRPLVQERRRRRGRMTTVTESLFPRYLFLELDDIAGHWAPIRSTRGVIGLVRFGDMPAPVPTAVIDDLRNRMDPETGCLDLTTGTDYQVNEPVRITDGPFAGHEALFQARRGEERVVVLLEMMQQAQRVTLPEAAVSRS